MSGDGGESDDWRSLEPWTKAVEWQDVAPEIAEKMVDLAQERQALRCRIEEEDATARRELMRARQAHAETMDARYFRLQCSGVVVGGLSILGQVLVAWHYADVGDTLPGLATAGIGSGLTAAIFGTSYLSARKERERERKEAAAHEGPGRSSGK